MNDILQFLRKNKISDPPWDYDFLVNLPENEYPKYLKKIFKYRTGEDLSLKREHGQLVIDKKKCKTFNQKIQWLKLYDTTDLKRRCTDKVAVRDYAAEKIGSEYLKPVLQIIPSLNCDCHVIARNNSTLGDESIQRKRSQKAVHENWEMKSNNQPDCHVAIAPRNDGQLNNVLTYFDQIDFDKLPNSFVIKCNHGCKWQYIIKDKEAFLQNKRLFDIVRRNMTGWLEQDYSFWGGFEMQYKGIEPKILIEPLMRDEINIPCHEIQVYCFSGKAKFAIKLKNGKQTILYNQELNIIDDIFSEDDIPENEFADNNLRLAVRFSEKLAVKFNFVRIDWMLYQNKLYFEEFTFTPYSGFKKINTKFNSILGEFINIERA